MDATTLAFGACVAFSSIGCSSQPVPGPDKLGRDEGLGAIQGAGAGMVVGAQVGAGTGPEPPSARVLVLLRERFKVS